jgi:hypothetical protein
MKKREMKQRIKLLKHLDKVADQYKDLVDKVSLAIETGDIEKAAALFSEAMKFRPTFLRVLDQAETYKDMLLRRKKRSQEQEQLKKAIN